MIHGRTVIKIKFALVRGSPHPEYASVILLVTVFDAVQSIALFADPSIPIPILKYK